MCDFNCTNVNSDRCFKSFPWKKDNITGYDIDYNFEYGSETIPKLVKKQYDERFYIKMHANICFSGKATCDICKETKQFDGKNPMNMIIEAGISTGLMCKDCYNKKENDNYHTIELSNQLPCNHCEKTILQKIYVEDIEKELKEIYDQEFPNPSEKTEPFEDSNKIQNLIKTYSRNRDVHNKAAKVIQTAYRRKHI
jgi:hypothetical protein